MRKQLKVNQGDNDQSQGSNLSTMKNQTSSILQELQTSRSEQEIESQKTEGKESENQKQESICYIQQKLEFSILKQDITKEKGELKLEIVFKNKSSYKWPEVINLIGKKGTVTENIMQPLNKGLKRSGQMRVSVLIGDSKIVEMFERSEKQTKFEFFFKGTDAKHQVIHKSDCFTVSNVGLPNKLLGIN